MIEILSDSETHEECWEKFRITSTAERNWCGTSPDESKAFKGSEVISAAPVVPDFQFVVGELFV